MTDHVWVYARTAETDTWTRFIGTLFPIAITELSAGGTRREVALMETGASHTARTIRDTRIIAGHMLKRVSDDAEFVIRAVRHLTRPVPGQTTLTLTQEEAAI